ncbi:MAG: response regulator transcription factor [Dokdonella sp.]|uniref:response regulator transcription factor n=1 Tax=Dokdonella sp. TaxID=2291710 RepID=UPI0032650FDB
MPLPILIVDDEVLMQRRLCKVLGGLGYTPDRLRCADGIEQAHKLVQAETFSLALVDLGLGDGNGIELVQWLRRRDEAVPILVVSQWNTERTIVDALRAGATGYVLKGRDDLEIAVCLRSALAGGAPIDPFIARHILAQFHAPTRPESTGMSDTGPPTAPPLSQREVQILSFVTKGLTNREIGELLAISQRTVENHVHQIYRKLDVHSRTEAVFEARAQGLVK